MRRLAILIISLLLLLSQPIAAYVHVDYDYKGATMVEAAYIALAKAEGLNAESIIDILDHYTSAEVASAGIWLSKFLERKALKDEMIFSSAENHYYKVILFLVTKRITPRMIRIGKELLNYPEQFLYWGPYLFKTSEDVMNLCAQFEAIVTNGKKSFSSSNFLQLSPALQEYFDFSKLGNVNWQEMWDRITNFPTPKWEDFREDFKELFGQVSPVNLAIAGEENIRGRATHIFDKFAEAPESLPDLFNQVQEAFSDVTSGAAVKSILEGVIGDLKDSLAVEKLFVLGNYNVGNYINDYVSQLKGQFYTQRWYIYYEEKGPVFGEEVVFKYYPDTNLDNWDYLNGLYGWTPIHVYSWDYSPTASDLASVKKNTDAYTGWSQSRVNSLNSSDPHYDYTIEYSLCRSRNIGWHDGGYIAYAYSTVVKRHPKPNSIIHEVYEDMFDSRVNHEVVFEKEFNQRIETLMKDQEVDYPWQKIEYKIGKGEKHYYELESSETVHNIATASFTVSCHDEVELAKGGFNFKVNEYYDRSKMNEYAYPKGMIAEKKPEDTSLWEQKIEEYQRQIKENENLIYEYQRQANELYDIADTTSNYNQRRELQNQAADLYAKARKVIEENKVLQEKLKEVQDIYDEYQVDYNDDLDGPYRIPTLENDLAGDFRLHWDAEGSWSGHTYTRPAHIVGMDGGVKFIAEVKEERGESWFWFIRYHRAIVGVEYRLVSEQETSEVVDVIEFSDDMSDEEKANLINQKRQEIQEEFPSCEVKVVKSEKDPPEKESKEEALHLLWMSDRVALARFIEYRLRQIDGQLAFIERNLFIKRNVLDDFKKAFFQGVPRWRTSTPGGAALQRWLNVSNSIY